MVYDTLEKKKMFLVGEHPLWGNKVYGKWSDHQIEAIFKREHDRVCIEYARKLNEEWATK